jgi:5-methylcytosine-specific restriction protein A
MPMAPPRACATCGAAGCTVHRRAPWQSRAPVPRVRGRRLQSLRYALLRAHPFCAHCRQAIDERAVRDHIVPLAEGGPDTGANTQVLCEACHQRKTEAEAKRGMARYAR